MSTTVDRQLAAARASLAAAGRHDRAGWLALFSRDGRVEDPVGSTPHIGREQLGRFYDTFIGPREITFEPRADFVGRATVVRDLTLNVRMSPAVAMVIPAILAYELADHDGELKVSSLQAYWELPPMMLQFARNGLAASAPGVRLMRSLWANQGAEGTLGFLRGFRRPGRHARATVEDVLTAVSVGDELAVRRLVGPAVVAGADLAALAERIPGSHPSKIVTAGRSVAVALTAGRAEPRGVLIADFAGPAISRLRFFGP